MAQSDFVGVPLNLEPHEFPYREGIHRDSIHDELHIVLPKEVLSSRARTLSFIASTDSAFIYVACLTFLSEAFTNIVKHRGQLRPETSMNDLNGNYCDRITVIMTYAPKVTHNYAGDPLPPDELLDDGNIAGYLFSFFSRDPDLKFSHALADQIDINRYGLPSIRKKDRDADDAAPAAEAPAQRNDDEDSEDLAGPHAFDQDEQEGSELENHIGDLLQPNQPPEPPPDQFNVNAARYKALDVFGSKYWFPKKVNPNNDYQNRFERARSQDNGLPNLTVYDAYKKINSTARYIAYFGRAICKLGVSADQFDRFRASNSSFTVGHIALDDPFHHSNAFSLANALNQLEQLQTAPEICNPANWRTPAGHFVIPSQQELHLSARLRLENFNSVDLMRFCLPHCAITDQMMIRPPSNTGVGEVVMLDDGRMFDLTAMHKEMGVQREHARIADFQKKFVIRDPFQEYFDEFRSVERDFMSRFAACNGDVDAEYKKQYRTFRKQGLAKFNELHTLTNRKLPEGNQALIAFMENANNKYPVPVLHLFESLSPTTRTPFAQWRINELLFAENVLKIGHFMVHIFPKIMLSTLMVWLPKMDSNINKEHQAFIGPPGTLKSDTILRIADVLIPGTHIPQSGGSMKGLLGPHHSQRLVEFYNELNGILVPSSEPQGSEKSLAEMKLNQLGDGIFVYANTAEDPISKDRLHVHQKSDYTNIIIGCKNPHTKSNVSEDGPGAAMMQRFSYTRIIPTMSGRSSMAEQIFQDFNAGESYIEMPREIWRARQLAVAHYCGRMACYGVPLPNIGLLSDIGAKGIHYLETMFPQVANRIRGIARIKTSLYAENLGNMANLALLSLIGLAGQAERQGEVYIFNAEEVVLEMQRYAYTNMETLVYVMSQRVYDMSEGQYNAITAKVILETTDYKPLNSGTETEKFMPWPAAIDMDRPSRNNVEATKKVIDAQNVSLWSMEEVIAEIVKEGKNYLGTTRYNPKTRDRSSHPYQMREANAPRVRMAEDDADPDEDEPESIDLLSTVAGITDDTREPSRLERNYNCALTFKTELIEAKQYVNFNYVRIKGTLIAFANSFTHGLGALLLTAATLKDIIFSLRKTNLIVPYIPVMPIDHELCRKHPGYVQAIRHSYVAIHRHLKLFNLPVIIEHTDEFFILAAFAETDSRLVIEKMVESMCYNKTRESHSIVGISDPQSSSTEMLGIHIKPRPGVKLHTSRKNNLDSEEVRRMQKQFGPKARNLVDYDVTKQNNVYLDDDIEEIHAIRAIRYAEPSLSMEKILTYTPKGIHERFYGANGVYKPGNKWTINTHRPIPEGKPKRPAPEIQHSSKKMKRGQHRDPSRVPDFIPDPIPESNRDQRDFIWI